MTLANLQWYQRIGEIRTVLQSLPGEALNRASIERIFRVPRRSAGRIMQRLGADRVGDSVTAERLVPVARLLAWVEAIDRGEDYATERHRRERLAAALHDKLIALQRSQRVQRQLTEDASPTSQPDDVRFTVPMANVIRPTIDGLPEGVELGAGFVHVSFQSPDEALPKLFALAQVIGHNWPAFAAATSQDPRVIADRLRRGLA